MLPKKTRYILYSVLLATLSVVGTTAIANTTVKSLIFDFSLLLDYHMKNTSTSASEDELSKTAVITKSFEVKEKYSSTSIAPMFATIIQGADNQVDCSNNGLTVARFNLCGNSDNRIISLSGSHSSISWQLLGGGCSPDINEDCPDTSPGCYTEVQTGATFNLDASTISATTGAEFLVMVDGLPYYFKVKKSSITQTFVKSDFVCDVPGRIQITNLSSAYEFSIDNGSGFGPWQGPIFDNLVPGTYNVKARLQNTPNTCEYPYAPITISQLDLEIEATFTDVLCSGDTGTITVAANNVPGPYKYTLLNSSGVAQEFTAFIPDNPYTFSAVGFGTYIVQVETQQCSGDPLNGINPPRQSLNTSGNPIVIGSGLAPLEASTEVNNSFGCATISNVPIILNTIGGAAPYTFTVNSGPSQPSYTGATTYTVTTAGTYDFLITDSNGCTITASANVEELLPPLVTGIGVDGTCTNGGATINFNITNARGYNLSYRLNAADPWVTNPQIAVTAGTYNTIEVLYQQGGFQCTLTLAPVTVTNVGSIVGSATKISDRLCDGTGGVNGGEINFVGPFTGGSGSGYVFSIDGLNFTGTTSYTNLAAGTYTPIIEDGGGCRLSLSPITINDVDPPTDLVFVQSNINCSVGTSDVTLTPTSNAAIIRYEVLSPTPGFDSDGDNTNTIITGLSTNTSYVFQITDANNCTYTEVFTPVQISTIRARVKSGGDLKVCNGATDGSGTFLVDGFTNNYTYNINGGTESGIQNNLEVVLPFSGVGTYIINVTDADTGCTDSTSFDILEAAVLDLSGSIVTPMTCQNNNIGRVQAVTTGGWGGNRYSLEYPSGITIPFKSGPVFGNLTESTDPLNPADVYTLTVQDSEGCTTTFQFDLEERIPPTLSIAGTDLCFSPTNDASITVASTGGGTGHEYRINNGPFQAGTTFSGLVPGTYTIEVEDDNNCRDQLTVVIPPQLHVSLTVVDEIPCAGNGTLGIDINGGDISNLPTTSYTILKDGLAVPGFISLPLPSDAFTYTVPFGEHGVYTVSLTDNNGCPDTSEPITFDEPTNIAAIHTVVGPSCGDVNSGFIDVQPDVMGGIPPFQIKFGPTGSLTYGVGDDGVYTFSSQTVYSGLAVGTYEYLVKDSRGCLLPGIVSVPVSPDANPSPNATVAPLDAVCNTGVVSGGIRITGISGGIPEYTYIVEDLFGTEITQTTTTGSTTYPLDIIHNDIVPGQYQIITLDARGCRDIDIITVWIHNGRCCTG